VLYQLSYLAATPDPSVSGPSHERAREVKVEAMVALLCGGQNLIAGLG
jgi:hypothetical protein